jgi:hypothetical protein
MSVGKIQVSVILVGTNAFHLELRMPDENLTAVIFGAFAAFGRHFPDSVNLDSCKFYFSTSSNVPGDLAHGGNALMTIKDFIASHAETGSLPNSNSLYVRVESPMLRAPRTRRESKNSNRFPRLRRLQSPAY